MSLGFSEADGERADYLYDLRRDERAERAERAERIIEDSEQIRNAVDADVPMHKPARYPYQIIEGQMVRVESDE
jgi:hypothetical protein